MISVHPCQECALGRAALPERCPFRDLPREPGAALLRQGEIPEAVWYVREGLVLVSSLDPSGTETSCALRGPGALLGLEGLLDSPVEYEAWTLSKAVVCRLGIDELKLWSKRAGASALLQLSLEESIRRQRERIAMAGRSLPRLARFLLERDARPEGAGPLAIEHQVLARMLGMRAETLSRGIRQLRDAGALVDSRQIAVGDREALARAAGDTE